MTMFCQYFGGTVFLAIAKSLFENGLRKALREYTPGLDPDVVINAGVVNVFHKIPPAEVEGVILAYNKALAATFVSLDLAFTRDDGVTFRKDTDSSIMWQWLPTVAAILAFGFSFGFGWKKVASSRQKGPLGGGRGGPRGGKDEKQSETTQVSSPPEGEGK